MYSNILVTLDGSKLAECVLPHLESVCKGGNKSRITLLMVVEAAPQPYGETMSGITLDMIRQAEDAEKEEALKYLEIIADDLKRSGMNVNIKVLSGKAADTIVDYINKNDFDLAMISTHGRSGISRWVWGSVADRILRNVCIPVMMVRAPGCGLLTNEK